MGFLRVLCRVECVGLLALSLAACASEPPAAPPAVYVVASFTASTTYDGCAAPPLLALELRSDQTATVTTDVGQVETTWADIGTWWLFPDLNVDMWNGQRWELNPLQVDLGGAELRAPLNWHSQNGPRCTGELVLVDAPPAGAGS